MTDTATQIPVIWQTNPETPGRLLNKDLRPLWDDTLALAKTIAAQRQWPLKQIRIELEQDEEIDWEYLILVLVFDTGRSKAEKLWDEFLNEAEVVDQKLNNEDQLEFIKTVHYAFEPITTSGLCRRMPT